MKKKLLLLIIFLSVIPLIDLLQPGLPVTHDGPDHVARIANFYKNLQDGVIIPRWAPNLNWGYGHPILMFLYPLPSYAASLVHFIGFNFVDSLKIIFALSFVLSGLAMYLWIKNIFGNLSAFVAAILYLYAPYRFVDLYVRGAIGEHVAFIFLPLIMYFLLKLAQKYNISYMIGGAFSVGGLLLSHNAISIMFLPLAFLYLVYLFLYERKQKVFLLLAGGMFILGFCLAAFFWIPAFFEGKYTLRDIVTSGEFSSRFVPFNSFIYGQWNYGGSGQFTTQLGIAHLLVTILSLSCLINFLKKKRKLFIFTSFLLFSLFTSIFLMTSFSLPVWETVTLLQKFQFPWRLLTISVFTSSIIGAVVIYSLPSRYKVVLSILITLLVIVPTISYWHAIKYIVKPQSYYTSIYNGTTDTGESAPIWSVRFMEKRPKAPVEVISGDAVITLQDYTSVGHHYIVDAKNRSRIRENTLYFPGWKITVDGKPVEIEFQDPANRGLMTYFVEKGNHSVSVMFTETRLRFLANTISLISLVSIGIYYILRKAKVWQRSQ